MPLPFFRKKACIHERNSISATKTIRMILWIKLHPSEHSTMQSLDEIFIHCILFSRAGYFVAWAQMLHSWVFFLQISNVWQHMLPLFVGKNELFWELKSPPLTLLNMLGWGADAPHAMIVLGLWMKSNSWYLWIHWCFKMGASRQR